MLVSLTVGKVDAGVAVLLTEDKRLIEFPSVLLPPDICSGSIVDVNVSRNLAAEAAEAKSFAALQTTIYQTFGLRTPSAPVLRCRNATQTSVVLEWDPIQLATAEIRSLSLYRNGSKAGSIPRPLEMQSTKISGLAIDTEYMFHLVLRTSAGTYSSEKLTVRTHKMTELSGITVTPGILPAALKESLAATIEQIGAKMIDTVRIDTTHFVCTEGRGPAWEKAVEMNIPVVVPDWVKGCEREGRIVGVRGYYLNADPRLRQVGPNPAFQQQQQQQGPSPQPGLERRQSVPQTPRTEITPPTPERPTHRASSSADGADASDEDDTGPTPPPKKPQQQQQQQPLSDGASDATTLADGQAERKSASEGEQHDATEDEDEEDDDDASTKTDDRRKLQPKPSAALPQRPEPTVEDAPDDDRSFEDVAF